jgi:hypothetical protein
MANQTHHVVMSEAKQKELVKLVNKLANGSKVTDLETRLSYKEAEKPGDVAWAAYSRFYIHDTGHVIYIDLRKMTGSVSAKPDRFAQSKLEKRAKRAAKAEARKAARLEKEETKAATKETKEFEKLAKTVKAEPKVGKKAR